MSSLGGLRVLLTRGDRDGELAEALRARGATVYELACVRIEPLGDTAPLASAVRALGHRDWLVVTSAHGADAVLGAVGAHEVRARVAAIGERTAARLAAAGIGAWRPSRQQGEALAEELPASDGDVLLARADRALAALPERLRARRFRVREVVAYRTVPGADRARALALLAPGAVDVVVFASPSAVEGLLMTVPIEDVASHVVIAIGPTTARAVRESVGREPVVADAPTVDALVRAITSIGEGRHVARA